MTWLVFPCGSILFFVMARRIGMPWKHLVLIGLVTLTPLSWSAGGHYPVDDADITPPGHVQFESWYTRIGANESEFAFLASWTPAATSVELTTGLYRLGETQDRRSRIEPAAKRQFIPVAPGHIGIAASIELGYENNRWVDVLLNVPVSYELPGAPAILHVNAGWIHDRTDGNSNQLFLGTAFEWTAHDELGIVGQVYLEGAAEEPHA